MTTLHGLMSCLLCVLHVSEASPAISVGAAAASGAIYAAGVGGGGRERYRDRVDVVKTRPVLTGWSKPVKTT